MIVSRSLRWATLKTLAQRFLFPLFMRTHRRIRVDVADANNTQSPQASPCSRAALASSFIQARRSQRIQPDLIRPL